MPNLPDQEPDRQGEILQELKSELHASHVRFVISWQRAEPENDVYDEDYLAGAASAIEKANAQELKVIISFTAFPKWASDERRWGSGGYRSNCAMDEDNLPDFQGFCEYIAARFTGHVWGYEAWNEPNLQIYLTPQSTSKDAAFGPHLYIKMLRRFCTGIGAGDPAALRIAGATAPRGNSTAYSSTPLRFAKAIKSAGVGSLFDAYSHHPYTPGCTAKPWPEAAPRDPTQTVSLQNLGSLLRIFPTKDFYLTEYGYHTAPSITFGLQYFSQATQADYLRRAYSYVRRYPQVKMLMWYLLNDHSSANGPTHGFYTGLKTVGDARKRSWYTFARGNRLTVDGPTSVRKGAALTLTGQLSHDSAGVSYRPLLVQGRPQGGKWTARKTIKCGGDGSYSVRLSPGTSTYFRLSWQGVVTSRAHFVSVK